MSLEKATTNTTLRVLPTLLAELPSIAALEIQTFTGLDGFALPTLIFPARSAAARASLSTGAHPSTWPNSGYRWCLQTRTRDFEEGAVFFSAYLDHEGAEEDGKVLSIDVEDANAKRRGKLVGYAKVSRPASGRAKEVKMQQQHSGEYDMEGVDQDVLKAWRAAQAALSARHPEAEDHFILVMMAVHPQYQKRGIGSALMRRVVGLADEMQTPMFIRDATLAGVPLYEAFGFEQIDTLKFEYGDEVVQMYTMVRRVPTHSWQERRIA